MSALKWVLLVLVSSAALITSCYKEEYYEGRDVMLRFSSDTLTFDTVFTERGSATRILKVYNDLEKAVRISDIRIATNKSKQFRLNIDGLSTNNAKDVEIGARDSIYIFAEVHINPDDPLSVSPFIVTDSIMFTVNNNVNSVILEAWGQNANYIRTRDSGVLSCNMGEIVWDDPRPYIIYGILRIDSCRLVLPEGSRVYMHGGIARDNEGNFYYDGNIYVYRNGQLDIRGTAESPVIIQTDRLETKYQHSKSMWYGIFILPESKGNKIRHAEIRNATIGIYVDSLASLELKNTKILHTGAWSLYARHAEVYAENCLFADAGSYNVIIDYGGNVNLMYCTIYNNNSDNALVLKNYFCWDRECSLISINPLNANITNSIIYGTKKDELILSKAGDDNSLFNFRFENCLVKVEDILKPNQFPNFFDNCIDCLNGHGENHLFLDPDIFDYRPDTLSIVIDQGKFIPEINWDIDMNPRDDKPDIGCYEFQKI